MTYPKYKNKHLEEALFNPKDRISKEKKNRGIGKLPKKWIITYYFEIEDWMKEHYDVKEIKISNSFRAYIIGYIGIARLTGFGSAYAAVILEELIEFGGRIFLNIGVAGGLHKWGFYLCTKALRDEGTSYHYLPHGHFSFPDKKLTERLGKSMKKSGIEYSEGPTWTTDAFFRETKAEIGKYQKMGIATVEMEAAALFTVAQVRKVKIASAFVVSDTLGEKWNNKFGVSILEMMEKVIDIGIKCLKVEK